MRYERTGRTPSEIVEAPDIGECCGKPLNRPGITRGILRCETHGDHRTFRCPTCTTVHPDPPCDRTETVGSDYFSAG